MVASDPAVPEAKAPEAVVPASLAAGPAIVGLTPVYVAVMPGGPLASIAGVSLSVAAGAVGPVIAVCSTGHVMIGTTGTTTLALRPAIPPIARRLAHRRGMRSARRSMSATSRGLAPSPHVRGTSATVSVSESGSDGLRTFLAQLGHTTPGLR